MDKKQAINLKHGDHLHYTGKHQCTKIVGKRGGEKVSIVNVRVSGKPKTWKTMDKFRVPVKYGLYENSEINEGNCQDFHSPEECPLICDPPKPPDYLLVKLT